MATDTKTPTPAERADTLQKERFSKKTLQDYCFARASAIENDRRFSTEDGTVRNLRAPNKVWTDEDIDRAVAYGRMRAYEEIGGDVVEWGR